VTNKLRRPQRDLYIILKCEKSELSSHCCCSCYSPL